MAKGVYKQKNSKNYWIRYSDGNGKIVRESAKTSKFKAAEVILSDRKKAIREGNEPEPIKKIPNYKFNDIAQEYSKWCERQRSFRSKKVIINQLVRKFGNLPLKRFNTMLVEQYQTERLNNGNKPATVNKMLAILKHCIHKGYQWEMLSEQVYKKVKMVKLLPLSNTRLRYLSKEECQTLIDNCSGYLKAIVITALNTGMRKEEILSLKWEHVDMRHGFIRVEKTKNDDRRDIPINGDLEVMFNGLQRRLDIPHLFYDQKAGRRLQDVKRSYNTALRRSGIKDFHFHDLRHTFASHLVMAGVDITTVSRLLGHKTLTMTLRYSHLAPDHLRKAVNMLNITGESKSTAYLLHSLAANQ